MARDPLLTKSDRIRSGIANWKALCVIAVTIGFVVGFGLFSTSGTDSVITGKIVRIEWIGSKALDARAVVRLKGSRQITIRLRSRTNCLTGSKIHIVERQNWVGRTYRAALDECFN